MPKTIERKWQAAARLGVGETTFEEKYEQRVADNPYVDGTASSVKRVRSVSLGGRAIGFFSDEIDELIEALRRWRDCSPFPPPRPPAIPQHKRTSFPSLRPPAVSQQKRKTQANAPP
jgi:hypothetical protein